MSTLPALNVDSPSAYLVLKLYRRFQEGQDKMSSRAIRDLLDEPSSVLRQLSLNGWIKPIHESGSGRNRSYALTPQGLAEAPALSEEAQRVKRQRQMAWEAEHQVYGRDRGPDSLPLTPGQARAWIRGYWQHQMQSQAEAPSDAPDEVREIFRAHTQKLVNRLEPHNPYAPAPAPAPSAPSPEATSPTDSPRARPRHR